MPRLITIVTAIFVISAPVCLVLVLSGWRIFQIGESAVLWKYSRDGLRLFMLVSSSLQSA
jgi:hypothetical protein